MRAPRSRSGALSQSRGAAWEDALEPVHDRYRREGHIVWRTGPPARVLSRTSRGIVVVFTGLAPPDFVILARGGQVVVAEAKSIAADRWPLAELKPHQGEAFTRATLAGHICGVILLLAGDPWWVPWPAISDRWRAQQAGVGLLGQCSLDTTALLLCGRRLVGLDWLAAALAPARAG